MAKIWFKTSVYYYVINSDKRPCNTSVSIIKFLTSPSSLTPYTTPKESISRLVTDHGQSSPYNMHFFKRFFSVHVTLGGAGTNLSVCLNTTVSLEVLWLQFNYFGLYVIFTSCVARSNCMVPFYYTNLNISFREISNASNFNCFWLMDYLLQ